MLIFDFDGVLINSIDEVVLTSFNAASDTLHTSLTEVPSDLVRLFKHNRFHVQSIGGAIPLMIWCIDNYKSVGVKILSIDEYQAVINKTDISLTERTNLIYETRRRFIEADEDGWFDLHQPYQPVWNELVRGQGRLNIILTNKNRDATLRLCRQFGLKVDDQHVYSGDQGASKTANMDRIMEQYGSEAICFIDDSLKNLRDLDEYYNKSAKRVSLILAEWGYSGPDDVASAINLGFKVYKQKDLIRHMAED